MLGLFILIIIVIFSLLLLKLFLSKSIRSQIENELKRYIESSPLSPTLDDFYDFAKDLPRRELLSRWTDSGIYRNAFKALRKGQKDQSPRLMYYNFSQIFQASDPDFGQGGLAAVMAMFNLELLRNKNKKLVFIADETPFFIKRCFDFFKFSTANVRKYGSSFITVAQNTSDVVVAGDTGILDNSAAKFLFSVDGEKEAFCRRLKIESDIVEKIENLTRVPGQYSETLLLDQLGARSMRILLSAEEYWRFTSRKEDNEKLEKLLQAVPGLELTEAIRCLKNQY